MSKNVDNDFFVGWTGEAPKNYTSKGKSFFFGSLILILLAGVLFVTNQKPYEKSEYEYQVIQELSGYLVQDPVWGIRIKEDGMIKTIPLVGYGKKGPGFTLSKMMENHSLGEGTKVTLRGRLTHFQGKYLMELTELKNSLVSSGDVVMLLDREISMKGIKDLEGEIVDPKCFFGVMNPATKAVHRSCAIRCISGGMPPMLAIREDGQFVDYYFLHGKDMQSISQSILPYVGIPVRISGQVATYDDWKSMVIDPKELRLSFLKEKETSLALSVCY
ncbi:MAG: hypothetical protein OXH57_11055 [Ekhidna sp.]|nr:hypothetical protein [Ekhidna sp.]